MIGAWHGIILLAFVAPIAAAWWVVRRVNDRQDAAAPQILSVTLFLATAWAGLGAVGALITIALALVPDQPATVTVPIQPFWPADLPGVTIEGPTAQVISGGMTSAQVTATGLSVGARLLLALGSALITLVSAAIAALIAVMCIQLIRGTGFRSLIVRAATLTATICLIGGLGSQVLDAIGGSIAARELLLITATSWSEYPDDFTPLAALPEPGTSWHIDFWPIGAALGFGALAAVFRHGSELQKETEGLV